MIEKDAQIPSCEQANKQLHRPRHGRDSEPERRSPRRGRPRRPRPTQSAWPERAKTPTAPDQRQRQAASKPRRPPPSHAHVWFPSGQSMAQRRRQTGPQPEIIPMGGTASGQATDAVARRPIICWGIRKVAAARHSSWFCPRALNKASAAAAEDGTPLLHV